jgi:uncharacterized protein DUF5985
MAEAVYVLCALTSLLCAVMLLRGYGASGQPFLLWGSVCFFALFANNVLLYVDLVLTPPEVDLSLLRGSVALAGIGVFVFGLVWEER